MTPIPSSKENRIMKRKITKLAKNFAILYHSQLQTVQEMKENPTKY